MHLTCYRKELATLKASFGDSEDQSINQSNFYSANIPGIARLSGARHIAYSM